LGSMSSMVRVSGAGELLSHAMDALRLWF